MIPMFALGNRTTRLEVVFGESLANGRCGPKTRRYMSTTGPFVDALASPSKAVPLARPHTVRPYTGDNLGVRFPLPPTSFLPDAVSKGKGALSLLAPNNLQRVRHGKEERGKATCGWTCIHCLAWKSLLSISHIFTLLTLHFDNLDKRFGQLVMPMAEDQKEKLGLICTLEEKRTPTFANHPAKIHIKNCVCLRAEYRSDSRN